MKLQISLSQTTMAKSSVKSKIESEIKHRIKKLPVGFGTKIDVQTIDNSLWLSVGITSDKLRSKLFATVTLEDDGTIHILDEFHDVDLGSVDVHDKSLAEKISTLVRLVASLLEIYSPSTKELQSLLRRKGFNL